MRYNTVKLFREGYSQLKIIMFESDLEARLKKVQTICRMFLTQVPVNVGLVRV